MGRRNLSSLIWAVVFAFWLVGPAPAAEFSAVTVTKIGNHEQQGKLYVKGDKARMEGVTPLGPSVSILRLDQRVMWILLPGLKTYMEMPIDKAAFDQALKVPENQVTKKLLGTETLHGCETEKYETVVNVGGKQVKSLMWISKKLEIPVRIESADKSFSQDYDIQEGGVDDTLFEMPAGYRKMTMPAGMPGLK